MAVKWAVANGNWGAGTTWNDGVVPAIGDVVYLNAFSVTLPSTTFSFQGDISNEANIDYNIVAGGKLMITLSGSYALFQMTTNLIAHGGVIVDITLGYRGGANMYFLGNIISTSLSAVFRIGGNNSDYATFSLNYQGNIDCNYLFEKHNANISSIAASYFNGIIKINKALMFSGQNLFTNVTLNGALKASSTFSITTLTINGRLIARSNARINTTTTTINGSIEYETTNNSIGLSYSDSLNILNPDTFTWKDVTEPRSNPFIILTDAEMNNRQQYPSEDVVKQGVEYVWGEKIGTYQAPPESVVLKDYVYDNGDKVGTLENEVIVDNTNTINVYPYKRRR